MHAYIGHGRHVGALQRTIHSRTAVQARAVRARARARVVRRRSADDSYTLAPTGQSCPDIGCVTIPSSLDCEAAFDALESSLPGSPVPVYNPCCDPATNLPAGCTRRVGYCVYMAVMELCFTIRVHCIGAVLQGCWMKVSPARVVC